MNSSAHVSLEMLADIVEHRITGASGEAAMAHVSMCSGCADILRRLQQLITMMKTDTSQDPPRDVLISTANIFLHQARPAIRRLVAMLTFDSRNVGPAFGMRSLITDSRQLLYSADDTDVDLRINVRNEECLVAGQVIKDTCVGGIVEMSGATGTAEALLNDLCEFTLPAVPLGKYSLTVKMHDLEIEIPELELKE